MPQIEAIFVEDPETGEVLPVERDAEYGSLLEAFYRAECQHAQASQFRVIVANGRVQVRNCCVQCGEKVGTALSQRDKEWVESLPILPPELSQSYQSRRDLEKKKLLLDLARRQYAERGRFTKGYRTYLKSDAWKIKRNLVFKRCNKICEGCGLNDATEVHHESYRHLFNEFLFELRGLCHDCHEFITKERRSELGFDDVDIMQNDIGDD